MSLREFTDSAGVEWQVWHVVPTTLSTARPPVVGRGREGSVAREERGKVLTLTPGLEGGWLCFDSGREKRRLAPVPPDWHSCTPASLEGYLRTARPVRRRLPDASAEPLAAGAREPRL